MNQHVRDQAAVDELPKLDSSTPDNGINPDQITKLDPSWDVSRTATRGHVLLERAFAISERLLWPSIMLMGLTILLLAQTVLGLVSMGSGASMLIGVAAFCFLLGVAIFAALKFAGQGGDFETATIGAIFLGFLVMLLSGAWGLTMDGFFAGLQRGILWAVVIGAGWLFLSLGWKAYRSGGGATMSAGIFAFAFVVVLISGVANLLMNPNVGVQGVARHFLTFDPENYFSLGGGLRGGPDMAWMANYSPKPESLTRAEHAELLKAVKADLEKFGTDAAQWEAVAALKKAPQITRAEKAITQYASSLPNGIVVVPEDRPAMMVVAHVEGQWSLSIVGFSSCAVFLGPYSEATGCEDQTTPDQPMNGYARQSLEELKPTEKKE